MRSKPSVAWKFFRLKDDELKVVCVLCNVELIYWSHTTSNMIRHLKNKHPEELREAKECDEAPAGTTENDAVPDDADESSVDVKNLQFRRPKKLNSTIWNFMKKLNEDSVECEICKSTFKHDPDNGTSNLLRHLRMSHPRELSTKFRYEETFKYRRPKKLTSAIWNYMKKLGGDMVECQICKSTFRHDSDFGTSNLLRHVRLYHPEEISGCTAYDEEHNPSVDPYEDKNEEDFSKLIDIVREYPMLYTTDRQGDDMELWDEVAKDMGKSDMNGSDWKKKWRYLFNKYKKYWKNLKESNMSQEALNTVRQWKYFIPLRFLKPHITTSFFDKQWTKSDKESDGAESEENVKSVEIQSEKERFRRKRLAKRPKTFAPPKIRRTAIQNSRRMNESLSGGIPTHQNLDSASQTLIVEVLKDLKDAHQEATKKRTDVQLFFDSCTERMERVDRRIQSILQMQILQLFYNAENLDMPPQTIVPLPQIQSSVASPQSKAFSSSKNVSVYSLPPAESGTSASHENEMSSSEQNNETHIDRKMEMSANSESSDECDDGEVSRFSQNNTEKQDPSQSFNDNSSDYKVTSLELPAETSPPAKKRLIREMEGYE